MSSQAITRATFHITEADLEYMALERREFPEEFQGYQAVREGKLTNEEMAEHGFPGSTAARFREAGRRAGFMRELGPTASMPVRDGLTFVGATVAHLFESPDQVKSWMTDVFLTDFESNVGQKVGESQQLVSVERLQPQGFFDEAVAIKALQGGPAGLLASTVIDFRVGRILGVAFVGAVGDHPRLELATKIGLAFEKRIVRVALGAI